MLLITNGCIYTVMLNRWRNRIRRFRGRCFWSFLRLACQLFLPLSPEGGFCFDLCRRKSMGSIGQDFPGGSLRQAGSLFIGASSLGSCRFLCRWRSAQIGRCFAGAFATPFGRGAFFLVFSLSCSSRCRISGIINTSQRECRPKLGQILAHHAVYSQ